MGRECVRKRERDEVGSHVLRSRRPRYARLGRRDSYDDRDRDRGYDDERDRRSPPRERPPPRKYDRRDDYDDRDRDSRRGGGYDRDRRDDRRGGYRDRSYDRGNHRGDGRFGRSDYEGGYRRERRRSPPRNRGPRPEPN